MDSQSRLCLSCRCIDFDALFEEDIKCFYIGTLADIAQRKDCSFCRFVVQVIKKVWARWEDETWEPSRSAGINVWVKTTLWAHYTQTKDSDAHFRYRPSLRTDWEPDDSQRTSYGSPRYTLCELDRVQDSGGFEYFTADLDKDVEQVLTRRRIPPVVDQSLLKSWMHECQSNHTLCGFVGEFKQALLRSTGRFRVIDVEAECLVVPSVDISYTALSYVWGGILHTKTDTERIEWVHNLFEHDQSTNSMSHRLRVESLPTTIIPDFVVTASPEGDFVLAMIGKGEKREGVDDIDPSGRGGNSMTEYIVLLLKKSREHFERAGLSIVLAGGNIPGEKGLALWKRSLLNKLALKNVGKPRFEKQYYIDPPAFWALRWVSLV